MNKRPVFVGIDVSKAHLDVAFSHEQEVQSLGNAEAGIESLVGLLQPLGPTLVLMEATGGFEVPAAAALAAAGVPVVIANPRQTPGRKFGNPLYVTRHRKPNRVGKTERKPKPRGKRKVPAVRVLS